LDDRRQEVVGADQTMRLSTGQEELNLPRAMVKRLLFGSSMALLVARSVYPPAVPMGTGGLQQKQWRQFPKTPIGSVAPGAWNIACRQSV
jgi:hypothetical protein